MNCGGGYGLEIQCVFKLYGPKQFVERLERLFDLPNNIGLRRRTGPTHYSIVIDKNSL